jgi:hypothetical protein
VSNAISSVADPGAFVTAGQDAISTRAALSAADAANFQSTGVDAQSAVAIVIRESADPSAVAVTGFDASGAVGRIVFSAAQAGDFAVSGLDGADQSILSSFADSGLFFVSGNDARSFQGEEAVASGMIVRTVVQRVAVAAPGRTVAPEAIVSAQRAGIDTTALGFPPAPPAPATIIPAPAARGGVLADDFGGLLPLPEAQRLRTTPPSPASAGAIVPADHSETLGAAMRHLARLTRELAERDAMIQERDMQIADLEHAVGAAFSAGLMMAADDD